MMKIETTAGALRRVLNIVVPALESWPICAQAKYILFDGRSAKACDLEIEIATAFPGVGVGAFCLPGRELLKLASAMAPDTDLTLEGAGSAAFVKTPTGHFVFETMDPTDWVGFGPIGAGTHALPKAFHKALLHCAPFISSEETRYYLTGICLDEGEAVATDGHTLGFASLGLDLPFKAVIPKAMVRALQSLPRATGVRHGRSHMSKSDHESVSFDCGETTVTGKVIAGDVYPKWRAVVPEWDTCRLSLTLDRAEFEQAFAQLKAVASPYIEDCNATLWLDDGKAVLCRCRGASHAEVSLDVKRLVDKAPDDPFRVSMWFPVIERILGRLRRTEQVTLHFVIGTEGEWEGAGPVRVHSDAGEPGLVFMTMKRSRADRTVDSIRKRRAA